jgi:hypothetical protein
MGKKRASDFSKYGSLVPNTVHFDLFLNIEQGVLFLLFSRNFCTQLG